MRRLRFREGRLAEGVRAPMCWGGTHLSLGRWRRWVPLLPVLVLLLPRCERGRPLDPPHIVIVSLDTLRADHLPIYGYSKPTAPRIGSFAREAVVFERAYSAASHTLPAHASLLTGVAPQQHGLISLDAVLSLPHEVVTLASVLKARGYRTGAFVNSGFLHPKFGLRRGFERYDFTHDLERRLEDGEIRFGRDASETNRAVLRWLAQQADERPVFLFVHYFDIHSDWRTLPYEAPEEYRTRFPAERPEPTRLEPGEATASAHLRKLNLNGVKLTEADRAWLRALYDAGIAYTDAQLGALLDGLDELGIRERAIVILTSDHGEEFQEHGLLLHEQVYEELVRVPLLISFPTSREVAPPASLSGWPGAAALHGKRIETLVRHLDLVPTLMDYLGIELPTGLDGESLLPILAGQDRAGKLVRTRNWSGTQVAIEDHRWKLVLQPGGAGLALFDLEQDPGETRDVAARYPQQAARLLTAEGRLSEASRDRANGVPAESVELTPELRNALEALGYGVRDGGEVTGD